MTSSLYLLTMALAIPLALQSSLGAAPAIVFEQHPKWTTIIGKDGHYRATFDDPNNEWRCYITSADGATLTIVCVNRNEIFSPSKEEERPHDSRAH